MWPFNKILKKKEAQQEKPHKEKTIDEILTNVQEIKKNETAKISAKSSVIIENIAKERKSLIDIINEIKSSEINSTEGSIKKVIEASRHKFISVMPVETILIPKEATLSSIRDMNNSLAELFSAVAINRKNLYYVSIAFPEKMKEIKRILISFESNAKAIKILTESDIFRKVHLIEQHAKVIQEFESKNIGIENQIKDIKNNITVIEDRSEKAKRDIEKLKSSKEYIEYLNSIRKAKEYERELEKIKTIMLNYLSPLCKPLKKFGRTIAVKKRLDLINSFIEDPLITTEKYEELKKLFFDLIEFISKDETPIDEKEKRVKNIKIIVETDALTKNISRYREIFKLMNEQKRNFSVLSRIDELEKEISYVSKIPSMEKEACELEKIIIKNKETISDSKNKLKNTFQSI
ncbi:MAG: hypothetical protein KJ697_00840 [Nanoarchaeota archaeon]|nr:hypothetical protein [Nanoarchaeota archaeon]